MVPDIVEIKRLCASGQWNTRIEDGKILLHDAVAGETVCVGQTDAEPVRHGEWVKMVFTDSGKFAGYKCSECGLIAKRKFSYCHCGAKMDGGAK